jgi:hypothetical protein
MGGALVAWADNRTAGRYDIYVQHIVADGPVAVEVALADVKAKPDGVHLTWQTTLEVFEARVDRRSEGGVWLELGLAAHAGDSRVSYEDRSVQPGQRYAYRLAVRTDTGIIFSDETWVDVPRAYRFALAGARPNPISRDFIVSFSLSSETPARMELYDLRGRRVWLKELRGLQPGEQTLRVNDERVFPAGVYWLRLTQGADRATTKVIIAR